MSRISSKFVDLEDRGQSGLIAYVMAGFPNIKSTIATIKGLERGGVDMIEIGIPFSDPLADGPTIQNASKIALDNRTRISDILDMIQDTKTTTPKILMTYTNILYKRGYSRFATRAIKAGVDGLILPDMSLEESVDYKRETAKLDTIFLVSPNTTKKRVESIIDISSGFVYMVAVYGTTGARTGIKQYALDALSNIKKQANGRIPVGVGFGVSKPTDVKQYVTAGADAVIVGSAYLDIIKRTSYSKLESTIERFTRQLKSATLHQ